MGGLLLGIFLRMNKLKNEKQNLTKISKRETITNRKSDL